MGQESLCLLFLYVQCQLRMNWPSTDDIWLLLWLNLTKTMFGHSCFPREHPTPSQTSFAQCQSSLSHLKMFCLETCSIKAIEVLSLVFWQGVQHFSHILLVVIEDEYTHPLLETAIISTRFLFIGIFDTVGSKVRHSLEAEFSFSLT